MICAHCGRQYDEDDFMEESDACPDICPDCLYTGNIFEPSMEDLDEIDDLLDELDDEEELDDSYGEIDVPDDEFDEDMEEEY